MKKIGSDLDPFEVTFFGSVIPLVFAPAFMTPGSRVFDLVRWNRPWLMAIRLVCAAAATPLSVMTFRRLPYTEAFALLFLTPSLVTILSAFVLKEQVRWRRGLALCAAFLGVLMVVKPSFEELLSWHFVALASALCSAAVVITGRMIGHTEERFTLIGTVFLSTAALSGLLMIPSFTWPTSDQWLLLTAFAATTFIAQALLTIATPYVPADRVSSAQYSQILWALGIGPFFHEWPGTLTFVGIVIVVGADLFIFSQEHDVSA
ncbi:DMT family transporter [Microvirga lotononidis]|uniref:DMT family transporter n=1 Tax=Microvirga lotononidis TaxID=864069 RepID=UPI001FD98B49|nr:DMT family transporter [Microvirga lotononidis]WQO30311.1 DMT family transporter [Microvirga lotononidis]